MWLRVKGLETLHEIHQIHPLNLRESRMRARKKGYAVKKNFRRSWLRCITTNHLKNTWTAHSSLAFLRSCRHSRIRTIIRKWNCCLHKSLFSQKWKSLQVRSCVILKCCTQKDTGRYCCCWGIAFQLERKKLLCRDMMMKKHQIGWCVIIALILSFVFFGNFSTLPVDLPLNLCYCCRCDEGLYIKLLFFADV